jgi:urease beta subunit
MTITSVIYFDKIDPIFHFIEVNGEIVTFPRASAAGPRYNRGTPP